MSPIQKGPYLQDLTPTSVLVRVEVSPASPAKLLVAALTASPAAGKDASARLVFEDREASTFHSLRATGLAPKTTYEYEIRTGGASQKGTFTTAPDTTSTEPFSFFVYGDNRTEEVAHAAVVRALLARAATHGAFVLNTGDFVQDGSSAADWQIFFDIEEPLLRDHCLFACVGNHELTDGSGAGYLRYFAPTGDASGEGEKPKLYGSFRWAGARFFLLNAMDAWDSGAERAWLEAELSLADAEPGLAWRIVVLHHSPWSAGPHGGNQRMLRADIPALLAKHKVDLLFAGHDHIYERGFAEGLRYVVTGGGGAPLYKVEAPLPSTRKVEAVHHIVDATVTGVGIDLAVVRDDGTLLERCGFTRSSVAWDCDPKATASPVATSAPVSDVDRPSASSRCGCSVPGSPAAPLVPIAVMHLAAAIAIVARRRPR